MGRAEAPEEGELPSSPRSPTSASPRMDSPGDCHWFPPHRSRWHRRAHISLRHAQLLLLGWGLAGNGVA